MSWRDEDLRQLALEAGGVGVVVWDLDDGHLSWSHGGAVWEGEGQSLPATVDELVELIHPEDRSEFARIGQALRAGEEVGAFDVRLAELAGAPFWIRGASRALRDDQGRARWIVTAVVDASAEHERVERTARDVRIDRLVTSAVLRFVGVERSAVDRQIEAALHDVAHLLGAVEVALLQRVDESPGWTRRARWPGPGDAARSCADAPPRVLDALDRGMARVLRVGDAPGTDWLAAPSGADADAYALVARSTADTDWVDADARRLSVLAAACCQTVQRATMAHELEDALATVDQLVDSGPIILWQGTTDRFELDTVSVNTRRLMGYEPEVYARRWHDLVHPEDLATVDAALRTAAREGRAAYRARIEHADGSYRTWQVTVEVAGAHGVRGRLVRGYSVDVTSQLPEQVPEQRPEPRPPEPEPEAPGTDGATPGGPRDPARRVLVVEDDAQGREVVAGVLRREGHQVDVAADVAQARAAIDEAPPDLVLTDVSLPDASGFTLLEELRLERPALPVVLMSGRTVTELGGAVEALPKPFSLTQLRDCVARHLGGVPRA